MMTSVKIVDSLGQLRIINIDNISYMEEENGKSLERTVFVLNIYFALSIESIPLSLYFNSHEQRMDAITFLSGSPSSIHYFNVTP